MLCFFVSTAFFHPFERQVAEAVDLLTQQKAAIQQISQTCNAPTDEALAVVFPELIRWSAFQNFLETEVLEAQYVSGGAAAADFSIGYFQMKPSFIEDLETEIAAKPIFKGFDYQYVLILNKNATETRQIRLARLQQTEWQLRYAHLFWLVMERKFGHRKFDSPQARIRFFATAYNFGFQKSEAEIEAYQSKSFFPYGRKYTSEQVAYADLSLEFYEKWAKNFVK
ncbi:MAG: hypothetical protein RL757_2034 [Bacteroidota bacterium]